MMEYWWKSFDFDKDPLELVYLFQDKPSLFFLDSSLYHPYRGRFSFIGFDPFDVYKAQGKDCLQELAQKFSPYETVMKSELTPLVGGIVGFLAYDYGLYQEKIELCSRKDIALPDCLFGFYDCVLTIDHLLKKLYVTSTGWPEKNPYLRRVRALERLNTMTQAIEDMEPFLPQPGLLSQETDLEYGKLKSNMTKEEFVKRVRKALDYIRCGDIYQVNLAQRFEVEFKKSSLNPLSIYRRLRNLSASSFSAFLNLGDALIMSSSPEEFLLCKDGHVITRPMKGTRSRGKSLEEDQKIKEELWVSSKEKAELLMVTDLERNDLGKVCEYGSISVQEMRTIEEYNTVFQATSSIRGKLAKDKTCFDVLQACFPSGSVTGCPKVRAMEIIEELEPHRRGIYTGALGYISFSCQMNFNILIRTLVAFKEKISFHVGSGIVADSTPEKEYEETLIKAQALRASLVNPLLSPQQVLIQ